MEEGAYRKYDVAIKSLAVVGAIASFWVSFWQYTETKEKEYKVNYWNLQIKACQTGAELSTQVAIQVFNNKTVDKNTIEKLYGFTWGEARLFLDDPTLDAIQQVMQKATSCSEKNECDYNTFNVMPLMFTQDCRKLVSRSWDLSLENISDGKKWVYKKQHD